MSRDIIGNLFMGIDVASTTSKMVLMSEENELLYSFGLKMRSNDS